MKRPGRYLKAPRERPLRDMRSAGAVPASANGLVIEEAPALPPVGGDAPAVLARRLARQGVHVDAEESLPSWDGGPTDYNWAVQWMRGLDARAG